MNCSNCGASCPANAGFCPKCGSQLQSPAAQAPWGNAAQTPPMNRPSPAQPMNYRPTPTYQPYAAPAYRPTGSAAYTQEKKKTWIPIVVVLSVLAAIGLILGLSMHKCDNCDEYFLGSGHEVWGYTICDDCWD